MNRARTICLLPLLFLAIPPVVNADSILTFGDGMRVSAPLGRNSSSVFNGSNSRAAVDSRDSAIVLTQSGLSLKSTNTKISGDYSRRSAVMITGLNPNLALIKNGGKLKKDKPDKGKDQKHDEPHALPEPPMAATLAMGLALLLFNMRRSKWQES